MLNKNSKTGIFLFFLLLIPSAIAYLLFAQRLGFYNDDWYLIYAGHSQGINKFIDVFASDRPARAVLVGFQYLIFGDHAPLYSYSAYVFRLLGACCLFWIIRRVWPGARYLSFVAPLLFLIYPGLLDQTNAFDFQTHLVSMFFVLFSIALTIESITTRSRTGRYVFALLSFITTLIYLPLMEYYIGLEGLRLLLVWQVIVRKITGSRRKQLICSILADLPALLGSLMFFVWRVFIFQNERSATNINGMFSNLAASPSQGVWILVHLFQDYLNTLVVAWGFPLYQIAFNLRLRDFLLAFVLAFVGATAAVILVNHLEKMAPEARDVQCDSVWCASSFWTGSLAMLCALIPIAFGDRHIEFPLFNRFTFPTAIGGCIIIATLIYKMSSIRWRSGLLVILCMIALMTHIGNALNAAYQFESLRNFWWQVSWRVPNLREGTTLVVNYPIVPVTEDYLVWGPANLIYYPKSTSTKGLTTLKLNAIVPSSKDEMESVLAKSGNKLRERRGFLSDISYSEVLVLTMPSENACVNAIDGNQVELSMDEEDRIQVIASRSRIDVVEVNGNLQPPQAIFGAEPTHGWCYFYEKASLARQRGDWQEVVRLADEAISKGYRPEDRMEWLPMIQAYAYTGQTDKAGKLTTIINDFPYLQYQACQVFRDSGRQDTSNFIAGQKYLVSTFCK